MSGAEVPLVVGLISGIISIVDATKKVYDAVKDKDRLPVAFREVAIRLPIVYDTLEATGKYIEKHPADGCLIENLIKSCDTRAKLLRDIFEKVAAPEKGKDSRADRYLKAVRVMGKGARVESLVKGILEDLQLLVGNHLVHVTSDEQNQALAASIKDVSDIEPSIPDEALSETSNSFYQSGGGNMFNTFGGKNQYYLGGGNQFQGQNLYFDQKEHHHHYHRYLASTGQMVQDHDPNFLSDSRNKSPKQDALELLKEECRQELPLTDPRDDRAEITSRFGAPVQGTCCWITRHCAYLAWNEDRKSSLLWICGEPATGKTYLSIFLTRELEKLISDQKEKRQCLAFYFCNQQDERRNTALTLIRGLMHFLLASQPELINEMLEDYGRLRKHNSLFDMSNKEALWRILLQMLRKTNLETIYFVLDALDECDEPSLSWLLPKLTSLMQPGSYFPTLKIIITSRQLPVVIHESLDPFPRILIGHDSNLKTELELFISTRINELAEKKSSVERGPKQRASIYRKWLAATKPLVSLPTQTFVWVGFAVRDLEQAHLSEVDQRLQSLPRDLDGFYARMLHRIISHGEQRASIAARIIRWVVLALRPLSLLELSIATETRPTKVLSSEEAMSDVLRLCGYFLKVNDGIVSLIHNSARNYLIEMDQKYASRQLCHLFQIDEAEMHVEIARFCLEYVQGHEEVKGPFDDGNMICLVSCQADTQPGKAKKFPFLQYAALYWPEHTKRSSRSEEILDLSEPFFQQGSSKQLAWLHSYWHATMPSWSLPDQSFDLLHIASFFGWSEVIKHLTTNELLSRDQLSNMVNSKCNLDMKPLHWAVRNGHEDAVKILLDCGADKSKGYGMPATIWAARNSHSGMIRLLLTYGFDINSTGYGMTALHWAVWENREEMVRLLMDLGASTTRRTTSLELDGAITEIQETEFPWTTVEEAQRIFLSTELEESKMFERQKIRKFCTGMQKLYTILAMGTIVLVVFVVLFPASAPLSATSEFIAKVVMGFAFTVGVWVVLDILRNAGNEKLSRSSICFRLGCILAMLAMLAMLSHFRPSRDHGPAIIEPSATLLPEDTCKSISHDIGKRIALASTIFCVDWVYSFLSSKVEKWWIGAYQPVFSFSSNAIILSTINEAVCRSTGQYILPLDYCILLVSLIGLGMGCIIMLSNGPPLGKTATELAVSKGLTNMATLLEGATAEE